jgi:predicted small secreted protein
MKKTASNIVLAVVAVATAFTACKKNTDSGVDTTNNGSFRVFTQGSITTVQNLQADTILGIITSGPAAGQPYGSGKFTLYSIVNNAIVANSDSATTKWDIGVRGTTIITNAGTSGPGAGGAFVQVGLFADLTTISNDSTFKTDNLPTYAITTGSNKGWYVYDGASTLINPIPGRVLVIRTANGKYAKLEINNYYRGGTTPAATATDALKLSEQRYYTFRYTYQADGTKKF